MIIKSYELKKFLDKKIKVFLFYGQNIELIEETIQTHLKKKFTKNFFNYEEAEILSDKDTFEESLFNKSFFESEKLIIINRASDKLLELIKSFIEKDYDDTTIILKSGVLEKKSKLRNYFEKNNKLIIIPFYEDNSKTLMLVAQNFFKEKKIQISTESINFILEKTKGSRLNLKNELEKIQNISQNKSSIKLKDIAKIITSSKDYEISELTDSCIIKNRDKTIKILNDNISTTVDNILILKSFLYKFRRLEKLKKEIQIKKDYQQVISTFKPPIFWKDKDIIKKQLDTISIIDIKIFIKKINKLELLVKKNPTLSNEIINNFIFETIEQPNNLI